MMKSNNQDIRALIKRYEISNRAESKSHKTVKGYNEILRAFCVYLQATHDCCDLALIDITTARHYILYLQQRPNLNKYADGLGQESHLSPTTVQDHVRALKAFASWLFDDGYTDTNRLQNLKVPKAPTIIITPLKPLEIKKIIAAISKGSVNWARNLAIFKLLLDTGLRVSEAAGITLANLNLEEGFLKVMGKGGKERVVPIGKHVRMVLFSYIDNVRPKPIPSASSNLFLSSDGKPITANTLKLMFARLTKDSGVTKLHAHLCRHTFATNYLFNGGDIFSLKEILGHTTFEMVNRYLHFTNSQITTLHHKYSPVDKLQEDEK